MSVVARFVGGLVFLSSVSGFDTYNADLHVTPDRHLLEDVRYGNNVRDTPVNSAQGVSLLRSVLQQKNLIVDNNMDEVGSNDSKFQWLKTPGKCRCKRCKHRHL